MEQATIMDLLQIVGILLKILALVVLAVTVAITCGVIVYVLLQSVWSRQPAGRRQRLGLHGIRGLQG
jgi:hypothetical protein